MKTFSFVLIGLIAIAFLGTTYADNIIFENEYRSTFEGFPVKTVRTLKRLDNGDYLFRIESSNFIAKLDEKSRFRITPAGIYLPLHHESTRKVFGIKREEVTQFDWDNMEAVYDYRDQHRTLPIEVGYADRTLYQYLMELDLQAGNNQLSYDVVDRGRLRDFTFEQLDDELLEVGGDTLQTIKFKRITDDDSRETLVWFAPSLDYRLVQIIHTEKDGAEYEMYFES